MCLLKLFGDYLGDYLQTSDLQFGFKSGIGCSDAVLTARTTLNYLTDRRSTAAMCALDLSKAFDKVDHYGLFLRLMMRTGVPKCLIAVLVCWYAKCTVCVRWGDWLSKPFTVQAGARQGGVLPPVLFAVYIDVLISKIKASGCGLHVCGMFLGCIVYAGDILLKTNSVCFMQKVLDICTNVAGELDLCFNVNKSVVLRVGCRYQKVCAPLFYLAVLWIISKA